jgi:transcriptional regulator of acetoin/glycerol metabolism
LVFEDGAELNFEQLLGVAAPQPGDAGVTVPVPIDDWFNPNFRFPESGFSLEDTILRLINHALAQTNGNVSAAGRMLGVSRDYLRYRLGGWKDGSKPVAPPDSGESATTEPPAA